MTHIVSFSKMRYDIKIAGLSEAIVMCQNFDEKKGEQTKSDWRSYFESFTKHLYQGLFVLFQIAVFAIK